MPRIARSGTVGSHSDRLVGRDPEVDAIEGWMGEGFAGRFRTILLLGEPGVGKTRMAGSLAAGAAERGVRTVNVTCAAPDAAPRSPVAELINQVAGTGTLPLHATGTQPDRLLESGSDLAVSTATASLVEALESNCRDAPLLITVDDFHWADRHTQGVVEATLATVADRSRAKPLRLAVLLNARPSRPGAPADTWHRISRSDSSRQIEITGLDQLGLVDLLSSAFGNPPDASFLSALARSTAGNPLHALALVSRLNDQGQLRTARGRLRLEHPGALPAAPALQQELAATIGSIDSEELAVAEFLAVLGDSAPLDVIEECVPEVTRLEEAIDQLGARGIISVEAGLAGFSHALFANEAYSRIDPADRARRHAAAAGALASMEAAEGRGTPGALPSERTAVWIAHQLALAGPHADEGLVADFAPRAAETAQRLGSWSDAARFWALAARVASARERPVRYLSAGRAAYMDLHAATCRQHLLEAISAARELDDLDTWGQALALLLRNDLVYEPGSIGQVTDVREAHRFLRRIGADRSQLGAQLLDILANLAFSEQRPEEGEELARRGLELLGEPDSGAPSIIRGSLTFTLGLHSLGRLDLDSAEAHYRAAQPDLEHAGDAFQPGWVPGRMGLLEVLRGEPVRATHWLEEASDFDRRAASWAEFSMVAALSVCLETTSGKFAEAERTAREARAAWLRSNFYITPGLLFPALAATRSLRGDLEGATSALESLEESGGRGAWRFALLVEWLCGATPQATDQGFRAPRPPRELSLLTLGSFAVHAELAALCGSRDMAREVRGPLEQAHALGVRMSAGWPSSIARLLCACCTVDGDLDAAAGWLAAAESTARQLRSPVEECLTTLESASLCRARGETAAAVGFLERAVVDLDQLGMLPHRSLAVRRLSELHDEGAATRPSAVRRYLLFTDICASTQLNRELGNERWIEVVAEHNRLVRRRLRELDGVEVKQTGDGMFAWFSDPDMALRCAGSVIEDMERMNSSRPRPVHLRAGVSVGEPLPMDGDLYGLSVAAAARYCDAAGESEVVTELDVIDAAVDPPASRSIGRLELKGLGEGSQLVRIEVSPTSTGEAE